MSAVLGLLTSWRAAAPWDLGQASAQASAGTIQSQYTRDNLRLFRSRTDLTWLGNESAFGLPEARLHATFAGGADLNGIPGGQRWVGGGSLAWIAAVGGLELRALAGFDNMTTTDSWRLHGRLKYQPSKTSAFSLLAGLASGWQDGWLSYRVRSTVASGTLAYATNTTWAEGGGLWDRRSGGVQPGAPLMVMLPDNRVATAYAWWAHSWTGWLLAGLSTSWTDAALDLHQPTQMVDGVVLYTDYPYFTPHDETVVGGVVEIRRGPLKVKTSWPIYSVGRYRVNDPFIGNPPYTYSAHGMTTAEVRAGVDLPVTLSWADGMLALDVQALSRPYRPYAWFTGDAWNQVGVSITVRGAVRPARSSP